MIYAAIILYILGGYEVFKTSTVYVAPEEDMTVHFLITLFWPLFIFSIIIRDMLR